MEVLALARHGDVKELVELTSSNKLNVNGRIELVSALVGLHVQLCGLCSTGRRAYSIFLLFLRYW